MHYVAGKILFRMSVLLKKILLFMGKWSQRAIEYPWLLRNLNMIEKGSLVLDVGCAESLLSHELIARGFRVIGIDIRNYPFKDKHLAFLRRNILCTKLPNELFDAIIVISTIEHIGLGLGAYGQTVKDMDGDVKALKELKRILKPKGIIIITTPYIGKNDLEVNSFERHYNQERLEELIKELNTIQANYYYSYKSRKRIFWLEMPKDKIDKLTFQEGQPGLACMILQKKLNS